MENLICLIFQEDLAGNDESIRNFLRAANKLRAENLDIVGPKGTFIELDKEGDKNDQIIAFARHYQEEPCYGLPIRI